MFNFVYFIKAYLINLIFPKSNRTFILKKYYSDKIILLAKKKNLIKSFLITENLNFKLKSRKLNCLIECCFLLENKKTKKEISVLLVCYEFETYIAEFLLRLGYDVNLYYYDLKINLEKFNPDTIKKINFIPIEDDIRNLNKHFDKPIFDYIFCSRGGLDRFYYIEFIEILNKLSKILLDANSYLISYVTSSFLRIEEMNFKKNKENLESKNIDDHYLNLYCENLHDSELEYLKDITKHYKAFNNNFNHPWLSKFLDKNILTKKNFNEISSSKNLRRLKSLNEISINATLFATFFSNLNIRKSYFSNYIVIKKIVP